MARERLQQLIASLHKELGNTDKVDDQSKELLQDLMRDVQAVAETDAVAPENNATAGRLETAALKLEAEHPKLSMMLGEIVDTLGKLGI